MFLMQCLTCPLYPGKAFIGKSKRGTYGDAVEEIDWGGGEIFVCS